MDSDSRNSTFQNFSTLLALLLPILQLFFKFLPEQSKNIFLIKDYFLVISIISAIFAYLLIIGFKNTVWFQFTFNRKQDKKYKEYLSKINSTVYNQDEIRENTKKYFAQTPYYINSGNVYYLLIPVVLILMIVFLWLGLMFSKGPSTGVIFAQAITYILLVALTSLTLAAFYINDSNNRKREAIKKEKYKRVVQLLYESRALPEFPVVEFLGQGQLTFDTLTTVVKVNQGKVYKVDSDADAGILHTVEEIPNTDKNVSKEDTRND
jgi:hypothetical protein